MNCFTDKKIKSSKYNMEDCGQANNEQHMQKLSNSIPGVRVMVFNATKSYGVQRHLIAVISWR